MTISAKRLIFSARCTLAIAMAALFLYGAIRFWDGPVYQCATGYCSGHHSPRLRSVEDYQAYQSFKITILICWPLGMIAGYLLSYNKRERSSNDQS
jgi:hypothetical protein